jgi:hypothetical protein
MVWQSEKNPGRKDTMEARRSSATACSGFGGLVVSMLPSGTQDRGFEPGRRDFSGEKIHSMLSFGREVKPFALCRRFAAG